MREDKSQAMQLRRSGKSYSEIRGILKIPKSTLSDWLSKDKKSGELKQVLIKKSAQQGKARLLKLNKIRGRHLEKAYQEARKEAKKEFEYFKLHPLFISGITIYWGEGDKISKHLIRIGNTDPAMIKVFVKFLLGICGIKKENIRAYVMIYPDLKETDCENFWIKESELKKGNFNKCVTIKGRHKTKRLPHGVCYISTGSTYLKEKINIWLSLLPKELINPRV
jgi:hypothetical protein